MRERTVVATQWRTSHEPVVGRNPVFEKPVVQTASCIRKLNMQHFKSRRLQAMNLLLGRGRKTNIWNQNNFSCDVHNLLALFRKSSVQKRFLPDFPMKQTLFRCSYEELEGSWNNLLKMKRRQLYLKIQFVPRSKHFPTTVIKTNHFTAQVAVCSQINTK